MSEEIEKQDNEHYSKNFTRIPNILFDSYKYISKEEKFLYCSLRFVYWDTKPRYVSLRELSDTTGYSIGALSKMLPRLHTCGLIHAEIRREKAKNGKEKGNPKYHITIIDIWEENRKFYSCSPNEQVDPSAHLVHENEQACSPNEQACSPNEQACSPNVTSLFTKCDKPVHQIEQGRAQVERAKKDKDTLKKDKDNISSSEDSPTTPRLSEKVKRENVQASEHHIADRTTQSKQTKNKKEITGSPEAIEIANMFISLFKKQIPLTQKMVDDAEHLVPCHPTSEDLNNVRLFCYASNPGWYGSKGTTHGRVTIKDIVDNWAGWVASQEAPSDSIDIPDELKERITKVYTALNSWRFSKTGDVEDVFVPNTDGDRAICDLLQNGKPPTVRRLKMVCDALWNEPRNARTGYLLREHLTVKMICNAYRERVLDIAAKEYATQEPQNITDVFDPDRTFDNGLKYFSHVFTPSTLASAGSK